MLTQAERRLASWMRVFTAVFLAAALVYGVGPFVGPATAFVRRLPFVAFSVVKVTTLALVCLYAGGSPRHRLGLVWVAVGGHLISVGAMLVLLAAVDTSVVVTMGTRAMPIGRVLLGAIALDGVILAVLVVLALAARAAAREVAPVTAPPPRSLSGADARCRVALLVLAVVFGAGGVAYELGAILPSTRAAFVQLPFVTNSVVKVGTLALVAWYVAGDVSRRLGAGSILFWAHLVSVAVQLVFAAAAGGEEPMVLAGRTVAVRTMLLAGAGLDAALAAAIGILLSRTWRARYAPTFLNLRGYRTLTALADVLVLGPDERLAPAAIARNVDHYFSGIASKRRIVHQLALVVVRYHPLLYLKPPLSELDPALCLEHLKEHFYQDVTLRVIPKFWRQWVSGLIRVAKQLTYVGYYNDRAVDASVGYQRFEARARARTLDLTRHAITLDVVVPGTLRRTEESADVVVIGSGAAGAVLAYRLAEAGRSVIVLERGRFVKPADFSDDEVDMIGKLYDDGVFQQTRDLRFTVLQGSCVGGTTVVNNAVCFRAPEPVVRNWNERWNSGVDFDELSRAAAVIEGWLPIAGQQDAVLNPSGRQFEDGIRRLGAPITTAPVNANIKGCFGCGYCNMGCAYGHKLSMLDTVLPWSQERFKDRVRIFAQCRVTRLVPRGTGPGGKRVHEVRAELPDGRTLTVRAGQVVVAAGAIASSFLLQESRIGRGLPVGQGLSFNMGSALTADFSDRLDAYDGLQISHYGLPRPGRGWVFETWWNPPVAQALNMPGWFEQHYRNMQRYPHLMAAGVLCGTESTGSVTRALLGGPDLLFQPSAGDRRKLADGLVELGRSFFAAGATRVMVNAWNYYEFTSERALDELLTIAQDPEELALGTGHPQGGNAISQLPERGVVGPDFRVHGWDNLFVCDASVIPSSLTVNPQLTVMSLAQYAAPRILERAP